MKILIAFIALLSSHVFGQVDFNNYTTLQSKGEIPEDFTTLTYDKLEKDLKEGDKTLNNQEEKVFFEGVNYAIDDILHSGYVTYGDEISSYLEKIADKLLKKNKSLRSKLRFYTLKSNSTNAFSTEQGIVFVTTGLISQVTSEAQIAYVLAHEISHYTEHHVVETFSYQNNNRRQGIEQMSVYSKDKEFEADKLGLKMYYDAGYSKEEILSTFDVLMYSYLPFDEIDISLDYFASGDSLFLPPSLFPEEKFEIKAIEDEDDTRSSHPNIKSRKDALDEEFSGMKNWKNEINPLGDDKFYYIRNIARFESIRNDVADASYGKALYSIYLMERDFPESMYIKRMKAQTWLGLLMFRLENKISRTIDRKSDYEGSSASVHHMIRSLKKDELEAMAIRQVYDLFKANSDDEEIQLIWDKTVKSVVLGENFELSDFSKSNYYKAKMDFELEQNTADSLKVEVVEEKPRSKYDRIKSKKDVDLPANFDSTEFHIYLLPDIIADDSFDDLYDKYKDELIDEKKKQSEYDALSYNEQRKFDKKESDDYLKLGIEELIVVEPTVFSYRKTGADRVKSEKLEESFSQVIEETSNSSGIKVYPINSTLLESKGTVSYNERSTLINMISQIASNDDIEPFPVDYQLLKVIEGNYGTSKVMFSVVENSYDPDMSLWAAGYSVIFYPVGMIYFPVKLLSGHNTEINMIILDTSEMKIIAGIRHNINDNARKHTIGAHVYSIFSQLNKSK